MVANHSLVQKRYLYNDASTRRLQECWVGRDRDARVIKELGLMVMAQRTTTCYALVRTGTRGKCGHQRETSSCRCADNGLWHCLLSFLLFSKHLSKLPRDFAKRAIEFELFFIDLDPNYCYFSPIWGFRA